MPEVKQTGKKLEKISRFQGILSSTCLPQLSYQIFKFTRANGEKGIMEFGSKPVSLTMEF